MGGPRRMLALIVNSGDSLLARVWLRGELGFVDEGNRANRAAFLVIDPGALAAWRLRALVETLVGDDGSRVRLPASDAGAGVAAEWSASTFRRARRQLETLATRDDEDATVRRPVASSSTLAALDHIFC